MIKSMMPMVIVCFMIAACGPENPGLKNAEQVADRSEQFIVTEKPSDGLYANAIKDEDLAGKVRWSLGLLQEELKKSAGTVPGLGEISILLDENLVMVIKNEFEGDTYEQKVNVASLNPDIKSIEIVVNKNAGEYPGMKFAVIDGQPGVDIIKNGKVQSTERFLALKFAERNQVQRVISAMMQAIQSVHGKI